MAIFQKKIINSKKWSGLSTNVLHSKKYCEIFCSKFSQLFKRCSGVTKLVPIFKNCSQIAKNVHDLIISEFQKISKFRKLFTSFKICSCFQTLFVNFKICSRLQYLVSVFFWFFCLFFFSFFLLCFVSIFLFTLILFSEKSSEFS